MKKYSLLIVFCLNYLCVTAFGGRPTSTGPAIGGSQMVHLAKPVYKGHDTTGLYVALQKTYAQTYNRGEQNRLSSAQVHKSWVTERINFAVGARGYSGKYNYNIYTDGNTVRYGGTGIVAEAEYVIPRKYIDFTFNTQASINYEFGEYQKDQQEIRNAGYPIYMIWGKPIIPNNILGVGAIIKPTINLRFGIQTGMHLPGVPKALFAKIHTSYRSIDAYFIVNAAIAFSGHDPMVGTHRSVGISYALPFGNRMSKGESEKEAIITE